MVSEKLISLCFESWTNTFNANNGIHTIFSSSLLIRWLSISLSCPGCHPTDIAKLIGFLALWNYQGVLTYCIALLPYCFDEFSMYTRFTRLKYFKFDWFSIACFGFYLGFQSEAESQRQRWRRQRSKARPGVGSWWVRWSPRGMATPNLGVGQTRLAEFTS